MATVKKEDQEVSQEEKERQERIKRMPILEECYNMTDFEAVARGVMKKTAWAYYSSGADDEIVSIILWQLILANQRRRCEKTTLPSIKSGSDHESSSMLKRLTLVRPCSEQKWISRFTLQRQLSGNWGTMKGKFASLEQPRNTTLYR